MLDVIDKVPNLFAYCKLLSRINTALKENSFRYRSIAQNSRKLEKHFQVSNPEAVKALNNFITDIFINEWF
jgi:hypothetical protein